MRPPHSSVFESVYTALQQRQFFKLICGGSFSDVDKLAQLIRIYSGMGVNAIDVSASPAVVNAAADVLQETGDSAMLMASFPLDQDPHFRKIELIEPLCIDCGACVSVCPTQVFTLPDDQSLQVDAPACYGCGRCVPICPTDALRLDPFSVQSDLMVVLENPHVQSVEIHTTYADPAMVAPLYDELGDGLRDKLISICLRPQILDIQQAVAFIEAIQVETPFPVIIQVDGEPMSGSTDPNASLAALTAARHFAPYLPANCFLTISGGINNITAEYLKMPEYQHIQGVGMGTYARQLVWETLWDISKSRQMAHCLMDGFKSRTQSGIL